MKLIVPFFLFFGVFSSFGQHKLNLVDENIFGVGKYVIRHRPMVYAAHSGSQRIGLMVGRKFKMNTNNQLFTFYVYWKHAANDLQHMGFRLDIDQTFFNKRLFTRLQTRAFWGVNQNSREQYYLIPAVNYKLGNLRLGPWGMFICKSKGSPNSESQIKLDIAYVGPSMNLPFGSNAGVFVAYVVNLKSDAINQFWSDAYLLHTVFYTRFLFKGKRN